MKLWLGLFFSILIHVCTFHENSATVLSARCTSRCLAKEIERNRNITTITDCITQECSACLKPCQEKKKGLLSCTLLCGSFVHLKSRKVCKESCRFIKHLHLEGPGNSSCPTGVEKRKCILMTPENVHVSAAPVTNKESSGKLTISWNGTWPLNTIFILMSRWHKKGMFLDSSQGWEEITQTTLHTVKVDVQPLLWHQFKVLAANEYTTSMFSAPIMEFANLRRLGPPREFRVLFMQTVKLFAEVDVSWRKPDNIFGLLVHRYKLSWSMRPDIHLEQFESFEVTDRRIKGNIHQYTISDLQPNKTYKLELQAIVLQHEKRLRSSRVTLTIQTPALTKENVKKKKKSEMTKNSITSSKTNSKVKSAVVSKPTVQGDDSTSTVSTHPSQATTQSNGGAKESLNLKAHKNAAGLITSLGLQIDILIALTVTIMCYL